MTRAGQPVANHNQFPIDKSTYFLVREAVSLEYTFYREEKIIATLDLHTHFIQYYVAKSFFQNVLLINCVFLV